MKVEKTPLCRSLFVSSAVLLNILCLITMDPSGGHSWSPWVCPVGLRPIRKTGGDCPKGGRPELWQAEHGLCFYHRPDHWSDPGPDLPMDEKSEKRPPALCHLGSGSGNLLGGSHAAGEIRHRMPALRPVHGRADGKELLCFRSRRLHARRNPPPCAPAGARRQKNPESVISIIKSPLQMAGGIIQYNKRIINNILEGRHDFGHAVSVCASNKKSFFEKRTRHRKW